MNRKEFLGWLVENQKEWPSDNRPYHHPLDAMQWMLDRNKEYYGHPDYEQITIHDWNRAKIKRNTKIRIESPEHSKYVQELAFELGYAWQGGENQNSHTEFPFIFFYARAITFSSETQVFVESANKEIFIEMPKEKTVDINAKILSEKINASDVLSQGAKHLADRAKTYDSPEGERSMAATVEAFESITGHALTEEQGWLFMVLLKSVRSQQGGYKLDNYEDGAAYFALMAEAASEAR